MTEKLIATMLGIGILCIFAVAAPLKWAIGILSIPFIILFFLWHEDISTDKTLVPFLVKIGGGIIASAVCVVGIRAIMSHIFGSN
jgi:hypothetical protein